MIVAAAGFSRGAFYSNFAGKEELITEMLADHIQLTVQRNLELLGRHREPDAFIAALAAVDRSQQDPLGRSPLLHLELLLYAARGSDRRSDLAELLRGRRRLVADIVRGTGMDRGGPGSIDTERLAALLLAMEDGFRLHQLLDPVTTPPDSFVIAVTELQRALAGPGRPGRQDT
jgi:AcrR family transcriptional regulator